MTFCSQIKKKKDPEAFPFRGLWGKRNSHRIIIETKAHPTQFFEVILSLENDMKPVLIWERPNMSASSQTASLCISWQEWLKSHYQLCLNVWRVCRNHCNLIKSEHIINSQIVNMNMEAAGLQLAVHTHAHGHTVS